MVLAVISSVRFRYSTMFFCTYVLPRLMSEFCSLYPQVTLTFTEGNSAALLEKLLNGQLDFILEVEKPADSRVQTMLPWC